jgi:hypothetical protein
MSSIVAAGPVDSDDGELVAVEVIDCRPGTEWVAGRVAELAVEHHAPVIVDAYGPLSSIIPTLERVAGVIVRPVRVGDVVNAAAGFCDAVASGRLAHLDDPRLDDAVVSVGRRKVGDRWAFNRSSSIDISPLVAASLAVWAVQTGALMVPAIH